MSKVEYPTLEWHVNGLPNTLAERTRRVYDRLAAVYPLSSLFFHSRAHQCAVELAGISDGMRVLEVATGSGEMFHRLVSINRGGFTVGIDLSPKMAARTERRTREQFPRTRAHLQAVDARHMPFRNESFDAVVCCYLLELLAGEDIIRTVMEFHRVLSNHGRLALVLIGQDTAMFNRVYKALGRLAPAFWGRQVEQRVPELIESADFEIMRDRTIRQLFYPSRVLVARKA